jgi:hypothetical protein
MRDEAHGEQRCSGAWGESGLILLGDAPIAHPSQRPLDGRATLGILGAGAPAPTRRHKGFVGVADRACAAWRGGGGV